ncbi:MAG: hypothetical protein AABZ30_02365 [Myxococcota bacterium]
MSRRIVFALLVAGAAVAEAPPKPWLIHANLGVNAYTYLGAKDPDTSHHFTPDERLVLLQQIGAGYFVHPNLRLQLMLQLAETLSGLPAGKSTMTLFGVIPWAVLTDGRFFTGAGPLIAPRSYGQDELDAGVFTAHGVGFPLGGGWGLAGAVQVPVMLKRRLSVQVSPAVVLLRRL